MVYVVRRKDDDKYYSFHQNNWESKLTEKCWLNKEQVYLFKKNYNNCLNKYLIYSILNPTVKNKITITLD